ncbi:MAG: hypothetical protein Q7J54_02410 [Candidatus Woesearchaeota archaeon]|nr:hypothetical protein [Candidatus Woesearchaeota archaeon]
MKKKKGTEQKNEILNKLKEFIKSPAGMWLFIGIGLGIFIYVFLIPILMMALIGAGVWLWRKQNAKQT